MVRKLKQLHNFNEFLWDAQWVEKMLLNLCLWNWFKLIELDCRSKWAKQISLFFDVEAGQEGPVVPSYSQKSDMKVFCNQV